MIKIKPLIVAIILVLACALVAPAVGQRRRSTRRSQPATKPVKQEEQPVFEDVGDGFIGLKKDTLTLDHSSDGRIYFIYNFAYNATTDHLIFVYVVKFDEQTPAGRSSLNTAQQLAKNFAIYPDQLYYIAAMQYMCEVNRKENTAYCYELDWTDEAGNTIAKCPDPTFSQRDNLKFIDTLLTDSHVNPEGKALVLRLGEAAKQMWDKARKAKTN